LVAKVSAWDLCGTTRKVLYVIVWGIIADILCSTAHLDAHTADLDG